MAKNPLTPSVSFHDELDCESIVHAAKTGTMSAMTTPMADSAP